MDDDRSEAQVRIRLLGGVSATTDDGRPLEVGPAKCQALLAALALSAGAAVPVTRLVGMVWGDHPPRTAEKTLQSYVTRLRKALGPAAIARVGAAYRLDVDAERIDVGRFQRRLAAGDLTAALAEWRGRPLAGLDVDGLGPAVDALAEQWLGAVELDLAALVDRDAPAAIGPLTELTAEHPFREGLWALLMTSLYRAGRQGDALGAYRRARTHLVDELGVEPGPRLRELEAAILGHDDELARRPAAPAAASWPRPGIPTGTVTFAFAEVEDGSRRWAEHRSDAAAAFGRLDDLVHETARLHGGHPFVASGDSFGVAFHRVGDALAWASELQAVVGRGPWPRGVEPGLGIGVHTGEAEERGEGYFGAPVNVAARLAEAAHGGQTLVSGVAAAVLDSGHGAPDLLDLGTFRLDGVLSEQRVLQSGRAVHPPIRTEGTRRGNLPQRAGRLIGRVDDLASVADALDAGAVVTLVGPGGIGKTRVALAAARRAEPDTTGGVWFVELGTVPTPDDVAHAVAEVLDVTERPGRTLRDAIVAHLRPRRALVVLDNCEHVVDGAADLARAIAEGCPDTRVLATSREGLGIAEEHLVALAPLVPDGPGVELFAERAVAVDRTFDLDTHRDEVEEICRSLDGVPLAIELAAARTRSMSPRDLVERLDDHLRLLGGGRRGSIARHRTLRATIEWSYDLLGVAERALFQRLSVFAGAFDLRAAEMVASADEEVATTGAADAAAAVDDVLGALVERSMVIVESGPFGRRFRLLETMRQYAAERLAEDGATDRVAAHHARWCLARVRAVRELLRGPAEIEGVLRLNELWPNLRAAVGWACAVGDRRLARDLVEPVATEIYVRNQTEVAEWAERILAITPPDDRELTVFGVTWAARKYMRSLDPEGYGRLVARSGEPDDPMVHYARAFVDRDLGRQVVWAPIALAELRARGDGYAADLFEIAAHLLTLLLSGRLAELDDRAGALVPRYRAEGPPTCLNWTLTMLGYSASVQGDGERAWRLFEDAAAIELPERTNSMQNPLRAQFELRRGSTARAIEVFRRHVADVVADDNMYVAPITCVEFVNLMLALGRLPDAARVLGHLEGAGRTSPGLMALLTDVATVVDDDPDGSLGRERLAGRGLGRPAAMAFVSDVLDHLAAGGDLTTEAGTAAAAP